MEVHHIGYLVKNIDKAVLSFEALGYNVSVPITWDETRFAKLCFMKNNGYCIELIEPSKDSKLYGLYTKIGNTPYHICYKCEDIQSTIEDLKRKKFKLFLEPAIAPVISNTAIVAFLMNANIGMIELVKG